MAAPTHSYESLADNLTAVVEVIYSQYNAPNTPHSRQNLLKVVSDSAQPVPLPASHDRSPD